jgi:hypothetical protein
MLNLRESNRSKVQGKAMCVTNYRQLVNFPDLFPLTVIQVILLFTVVTIIFVRDLKMLIFTLYGLYLTDISSFLSRSCQAFSL